MKHSIKLIIILFLIVSTSVMFAQEQADNYSKLYKSLPFKMEVIKAPKFPNRDFNIKKYNAVGDGLTLNTSAFNKAIEECSRGGGGRVIVPAGIWLTGPIFFKDNVNLYLEQGALIQFTNNYDDYPLIEGFWEGYTQFRCTSPIMGKNLKNIAITGKGTIDGAGQYWRPVKKSKLTESEWKNLVKSGGAVDKEGETWWPSKEAMEALEVLPAVMAKKELLTKEKAEKYKLFFRPVLLSFVNCRNVLLDGVTFQNSPAWNLHPLFCENLIITNLMVRNPWYAQNGDGIDIESCKNTLLYNCKFDVGDDGICIKSGRDKEGRQIGKPTENLIVSSCIVYHGHGGFTVGSEMSGGVRNVKVDNCNFNGTDVGLRFKSQRGRGGIVENIWISNIYMKDIPAEAISFNLFYSGVSALEEKSADGKAKIEKTYPVTEETPIFRNIYMDNIICSRARDAVVLRGLPEMPLENINLKNISISSQKGISISDAEKINITNAKILTSDPAIKIKQGSNITISNFTVDEKNKTVLSIEGEGSNKIIFIGGSKYSNKIKLSDEVAKDALKFE